jgi:hypothetical protein
LLDGRRLRRWHQLHHGNLQHELQLRAHAGSELLREFGRPVQLRPVPSTVPASSGTRLPIGLALELGLFALRRRRDSARKLAR